MLDVYDHAAAGPISHMQDFHEQLNNIEKAAVDSSLEEVLSRSNAGNSAKQIRTEFDDDLDALFQAGALEE